MVCPVCQIDGGFYLRMEKCHGCSQEPSPWRRFFCAFRTSSVKIDGFEGLSNITHADLCYILNLSA